MTQPEGWLHRAPRPLMMWLALFCVLSLILFFWGVGTAVVTAAQRAATEGRDMPDMSGGLPGILTGMGALLPAIVAFWQVFNQRHVERRDQIARGGGPSPFVPSEPSPTGGLVNNEAISE